VGRRFDPAGVGKLTVILGLTLGLGVSGCILSPRHGADDVENVLDDAHSSDRAMSALTKGDVSTAENLAQAALKRNPKDPYALLVAGMAYQASGRYELARQYFEVIVSNRPSANITLPDDKGNVQLRPIVEIAQANLEKIDAMTGRNAATTVGQSGRALGMVPPAPRQMDGETIVANRFKVLRRLLEEDLITPDEYAQRRTANLGALLPLTGGQPSAGLDRPVPDETQIIDRLRMLKSSIEAREMQPREAAAERSVILDGLLPAKSAAKAIPPLPPKDVLEVAEAVRRLEKMQTADLISSEEAQKEKLALGQELDKQMATKSPGSDASGLKYGIPPVPKAPMPTPPVKPAANDSSADKSANWGVVLGTAKDEEEARTLAAQIKSKFPEELGNKALSVRKVAVKGGEKWQIVTPSENKADAGRLCKTMRLHRQGCEPTTL